MTGWCKMIQKSIAPRTAERTLTLAPARSCSFTHCPGRTALYVRSVPALLVPAEYAKRPLAAAQKTYARCLPQTACSTRTALYVRSGPALLIPAECAQRLLAADQGVYICRLPRPTRTAQYVRSVPPLLVPAEQRDVARLCDGGCEDRGLHATS